MIVLDEHAPVAEDAIRKGGGGFVQQHQIDAPAGRGFEPRRETTERMHVAWSTGTEFDRNVDVAGGPGGAARAGPEDQSVRDIRFIGEGALKLIQHAIRLA